MIAALRYEWVRIRTIRSTYWVTGTTVVLATVLSFLLAWGFSASFEQGGSPDRDEIAVLGASLATQFAAVTGPYFVIYALSIIGVFAWGHEYRHGMVRATLTAVSSRVAVWGAKYVVTAAWVLTAVLLTMLLSSAMGWLWLGDDDVTFLNLVMLRQVGKTLLYCLLFLWIAMALTSLLRNQTAALAVLFIWPLAVETVVGLVMQAIPGERFDGVSRYLPYNAGDWILRTNLSGSAEVIQGGAEVGLVTALVIFGGLTALLMAASWVLFDRRDA